MQKWEYKIVTSSVRSSGDEQELNRLGEEGWELVAATWGDTHGSKYIFKRRKS